jgi:hypothetical protein
LAHFDEALKTVCANSGIIFSLNNRGLKRSKACERIDHCKPSHVEAVACGNRECYVGLRQFANGRRKCIVCGSTLSSLPQCCWPDSETRMRPEYAQPENTNPASPAAARTRALEIGRCANSSAGIFSAKPAEEQAVILAAIRIVSAPNFVKHPRERLRELRASAPVQPDLRHVQRRGRTFGETAQTSPDFRDDRLLSKGRSTPPHPARSLRSLATLSHQGRGEARKSLDFALDKLR